MATCLREAASAGMEPLVCRLLLPRRLAAFFNIPVHEFLGFPFCGNGK